REMKPTGGLYPLAVICLLSAPVRAEAPPSEPEAQATDEAPPAENDEAAPAKPQPASTPATVKPEARPPMPSAPAAKPLAPTSPARFGTYPELLTAFQSLRAAQKAHDGRAEARAFAELVQRKLAAGWPNLFAIARVLAADADARWAAHDQPGAL